MRAFLLAGTSLLVLSVSIASAPATTFSYTNARLGLQTYAVPADGTYSIEAVGASGGTETYKVLPNADGGLGADVTGNFILTEGEALTIRVGQAGANGPSGIEEFGAGGGGGGSFVVGPGNAPLLVAGGGGGGGASTGQDGVNAGSTSATSGNGHYGGTAGSNRNGGAGGGQGAGGGGGGGFSGLGGPSYSAQGDAGAGGSPFTGLHQYGGSGANPYGGYGGLGGGGGGGNGRDGGGGGGGGYSGGGGGGAGAGGGAGGSFDDGTNISLVTASSGGNGSVTITYLSGPVAAAPVPEPASLALFGSGLAGLGLVRRRRRV